MKAPTLLLLLGFLTSPFLLTAADWPQFRGPNGDGISLEDSAPLTWSKTENVKWRAPLPGPGNSSPIVSQGKVFLTCAEDEGKTRSLYCFDRATGKELWVRSVDFAKVMPTHKTNPYEASSPVANGKVVVAWHGSAGAFCYDFEGKKLWQTDLGEYRHMWGYASSPVIYQDKVILNCGPGQKVSLTALDLRSGEIVWQTEEPVAGDGQHNEDGQYVGSWSTPVITKIDGKDQILCTFNTRVNGYDPQTGELLWYCLGIKGRKGELAYSSPMVAGDVIVSIGGFGGPSIGFNPGGKGDITEMRLWRNESNPQSIGSGVYVKEHLFVPDAAQGSIRCIDPQTGKDVWRERVEGPDHWGSVVMAAGRLYVTNQQGQTVVFSPDPAKFEKLAVNDLGERSNSTPAISDGELFIRTNQALYCISE